MLNRMFGKKKETAPAPTLDDASTSIGNRISETEVKIRALDEELRKCKLQMARLKGPARQNVMKRATQILKQKKVYERHRDGMFNQQFNIDQTKFSQEMLKDTATTVKAMKAAQTELKKSYEDIDIDEIEDLHEDMAEMMYMQEEVNELMSRSYAVDDIDVDDLEAELDELGDELAEEDEIPSYLVNAASARKTAEMNQNANATPAQVEKDEFGLPVSRVVM